MWFVAERYVHCVTGVTHLSETEPFQTFGGDGQGLNANEADGLKAILEHLKGLSEPKRGVPKEIVQPDVLLQSLQVAQLV